MKAIDIIWKDKEKDKALDNLEAIQNEIKPAQKNGKARAEVK